MKATQWRASVMVAAFVAAAVLAALAAATSWARPAGGGQGLRAATGRIHGTVKDQSGGAIVGAAVTIANVEGTVARRVATDESGQYSASDLRPGTYMVRAEFAGFQAWERTNISLKAGDDLASDVVLQVGGRGSSVTILEVGGGSTIFNGPLPRPPLRIFCSTAVHTPMEDMKPQLEREAGRPVIIDWDSSTRLSAKIDAGEAFDIAVLSVSNMASYELKGTIATPVYFGRTGAAMAVRRGAPKPDISTREKLKQVLLNAKSIAMNPTGASGVHFNRIIAEMGIAEQIKPKMVLSAEPGSQARNVAEGRAEMIWTQSTEIGPYPGIEMIGPLPADVQSYTEFSIGVAAKGFDTTAAGRVVRYLTSDAEAKAMFRAAFVEVR